MINKRLQELRAKNNFKQKELGDLLNISPEGYGHYESGKRKPSPESIATLALFYNVSADYLLGNTDDPTPPNKQKQEQPPNNWELFEQEFIKMFGREPTDSDIDKALLHLRVDAEFQKKEPD